MSRKAQIISISLLVFCSIANILTASPPEESPVRLTVAGGEIVDPDDMCFVVLEPTSDVFLVVSDKKANAVFLIDNQGHVRDKVSVPQPGNIDSRPAFPVMSDDAKAAWQNELSIQSPLIVVNGRQHEELVALTVVATAEGPKLRKLPSKMPTGENYGGCLYRDENRFYFFSTTKGGLVQQWEIANRGDMLVSRRVRAWKSPICEGAVADDQNGVVFLCEEQVGIRKIRATPRHDRGHETLELRGDHELIVRIGDHDITGDLEGITLLRTGKTTGYLVASDQASSQFVVFDRQSPHRFVGKFSIDGVRSTDGVDVFPSPFGTRFRNGVIACHSDTDDGCKLVVASLPRVFAFEMSN